ncbi:MAG: hypothetical protein HYV19_04310 [Gemmatimonadetes bacterium]|nr:hypothetical protein [Gemmatimonadota bacterium]
MKLQVIQNAVPTWINPAQVSSIEDRQQHATITMVGGKVHQDTRTGEQVFEAWKAAMRAHG